MENYSVSHMKKVIDKLKKINVIAEKDIINLKVSDIKKLKQESTITMRDIEIIWKIQEMIQEKSWFEILFNSK